MPFSCYEYCLQQPGTRKNMPGYFLQPFQHNCLRILSWAVLFQMYDRRGFVYDWAGPVNVEKLMQDAK
jgi:hypothetical protein